MQNYPSEEQLAELTRQLTQARIENFFGHEFGTWRWWLLVVLLIVPWPIWYKFADKKKLVELVMFGLIVMVLSITMDELGFVLSLWSYKYEVLPMFPRLTSIDYTIMPITFMLTYQYFPTWKSFFWAVVAVSGIFSFVVEPLIVKLGFYVLIKWWHPCSFIIYIIMGLISRWMVRTSVDIMHRHNAK